MSRTVSDRQRAPQITTRRYHAIDLARDRSGGAAEVSESFEVGDWVVVNYHQRYEPGQIIKIMSEHLPGGTVGPLLRIDFGRFMLHLAPDEVSRDTRR